MLAEHLADAIGNAPLRLLDDLARDIWRGLGTGMLSEGAASSLSEAIEARRAAGRASAKGELKRPSTTSLRGWSYFPPKRPQRSPDRARSIARRRQLASASPLPPSLAPRFTCGELAALAVIGSQVADHGACDRSIPELAARAGVSASTVRNAVREARRLGLVTVEERRQHCAPNLANVVRIVSAEWLAWIARRPKAERVQKAGGHGELSSFSMGEKLKAQGWRRQGTHQRTGCGKGDRWQARRQSPS